MKMRKFAAGRIVKLKILRRRFSRDFPFSPINNRKTLLLSFIALLNVALSPESFLSLSRIFLAQFVNFSYALENFPRSRKFGSGDFSPIKYLRVKKLV